MKMEIDKRLYSLNIGGRENDDF